MRISPLVLACLTTTSVYAQDAVSDLAWLAGCWTSPGAESGSGEMWTLPAGGTMFGVSRTVRNAETVAHEFMQIRETESGGIEFVAAPSGQTGATFLAVEISASEVIFENPEHDFPQRVIYRRNQEGNLEARIEGEINGQARSVDFPLLRGVCPGR